MNVISLLALALSMSTDAFAASLVKGTNLRKSSLREALRTGLIFGVIETITPLIGWCLGSFAARFITEWDHWVAFGLLSILGLRMIKESLFSPKDEARPKLKRNSFRDLCITGFATSIDAMAVGVTLALIEVNILYAAALIGGFTFVMVTLGILLGEFIGARVGKGVELLGGLVLIGIGSLILYEHLTTQAVGIG